MSRFTLALNSHSLSAFQRCETNYMLGHLIGIESVGRKFAFKRGTIIGRYLNVYYYNQIHPKVIFKKCLNNPIFWVHKIQKEVELDQNAAFNLFSVLVGYSMKYKDDNWIPLAVEKGFSKVLYEDSDNLFVYEGRIDLLATNPKDLMIADHKTESANRPIYEFNNQCIGYLWASGASQFIYNYLTLTKVPVFHRAVHIFTPLQVDAWVSLTTEWFFRVKHSVENKSFLSSLQCTSIYGKCPFHLICEQPKQSTKEYIIGANYRKREPYRSW